MEGPFQGILEKFRNMSFKSIAGKQQENNAEEETKTRPDF